MNPDPSNATIHVEVAYALPDKQKIVALDVPQGTTAYQAAVDSGIASMFEGLVLDELPMGIFGKAIKPQDYQLVEGDRVEIYRPLQADPKATRKARAEKAKSRKESDA